MIPRAAARVVDRNPFGDGAPALRQSVHRTPGSIEGTRELVISGTPYIVAYRVTDAQIEVLFVQHGAREWPADA